MATIKMEEAQAHLPQIIEGLNPGEPLIITKDGKPVAPDAPSFEAVALQGGQRQGDSPLDGTGLRCPT